MSTVFNRRLWHMTMDWLDTGESGMPDNVEKQLPLELAAQQDPDVALVDTWYGEAQPIPDWALKVDRATPHWGVEICNEAWLPYLQSQVQQIGKCMWYPSVGWCGGASMARRQWASYAVNALSHWIDGTSNDTPNPIRSEIASILRKRDSDKIGAVRLLKETIELSVSVPPREFDTLFTELPVTTSLAEEMRDKIKYLQFTCGYRWEKIVLEICQAIGDLHYRQGHPRFWHVGCCNGQIAFAHRDVPLHIPTTVGILIGLWSWLKEIPLHKLTEIYPQYASLAKKVSQQLGSLSPVKRWLAGRLFVGMRIWLEEYDHGDLVPPHPALDVYPSLGINLAR